ncbi:hypothetical protein N7507_005780 [Penicillium longicatenatum]|nr:hypothetical protein N7507_005780 [Penicillium longicatenatum]
MSSFPEDQPPSSQLLPPQSAQVRGSIFGGPSNAVDPPSSRSLRPRRSIFGGPSSQNVVPESELQSEPMSEIVADEEDDDLDLTLGEEPLNAYHDSSGDSSYQESSDEEAKKPKKRATSAKSSSSLVSQSQPPKEGAQKITYVLHRGIDLPPGQERPNRWTESPSRYRRAIEGEQGVYDALMDSRAQDLAAHLYNTYVAYRQPKQQDNSGDPQRSEEEEKSFRKRWVAWPMPAPWVPRASEAPLRELDGSFEFQMPSDTRPSAELEECVIATMMKAARERFEAREWDELSDDENAKVPAEENTPDPDMMEVDNDETNHQNENEGHQSDSGKRKRRMPIISVDDGASGLKLRPLSRTAISHLDQLLMGLHHSLKNRGRDVYDSDDSATDTDDDGSRSRSRSRHKGRKRSHSRGRKLGREDRRSGKASREISGLRSSPRIESKSHDPNENAESMDRSSALMVKMLQRFPLRDWSEVMGVASMVGLPPKAVKRAAKRCADLLEQDMAFRTFHEGRIEKVGRLPNQTWDYDYVESETDDENDIESGRPHKRRTQSRNSSRGATRSPSRQPHAASAVVPAVIPAPPPVSVSLPGSSNQKTAQKPTPARQPGFENSSRRQGVLFCPFSSCSRSQKGFSRTWNYNQHMKNRHPHAEG